MSKFGLVVLGAHIGIHIKSEVQEILPEKILLVEPKLTTSTASGK